MTTSPLYIASDHAGVALKTDIYAYLTQTYPAYTVIDLGTDNADISVDYPDYGNAVAQHVVSDANARGIIMCGSGIGISIAANRIAGARAALCMTAEMARLAREHNDANILALGARMITKETAFACVDAFLTTDFAGGRHSARVQKLG